MPIDGVPTEIVGVMPPGFVCPPAFVLRGAPPTEPAELWLPHATNLEAGQRGAHYLSVIARLRSSGDTRERQPRIGRHSGSRLSVRTRITRTGEPRWCRSSNR